MLFRLALLIIVITSLTGCTLPGTQLESEKQEGTIVYIGTGFRMNIPTNWNTTPDSDMIHPKTGQIILSAVSPESRYGFSNNILIMKDILGSPITSKKYSELNQIQTSKKYLEYTKTGDKAILFTDDDESRATIFEARYNNTTARMKFIQTAKVCGTDVYLLHATTTLDRDAENYIRLFKTFRCD